MERIAALFFPALPLQIVVRDEPELKEQALAVVFDHRVVFVNKKAHGLGIRPDMADHLALRLVSGLQIRNLEPGSIEQHRAFLSKTLSRYSPGVESHPDRPGLFLLDASGLTALWRNESEWAQSILSDMENMGWSLRMVLGHRRFTVTFLALASRKRLVVSNDFIQEARACRQLPLSSFALPDQEIFDRLGLSHLDDLLALPRSQATRRFSDTTIELMQQADLALKTAEASYLSPDPQKTDPQADLDIEDILLTADSLLFLVKRSLHKIMTDLEFQKKALSRLILIFEPDGDAHHEPMSLEVRPASPTTDLTLILDLLRLRIEGIQFDAPPSGIRIDLHTVSHEPKQVRLFSDNISKNIEHANRELARLKAQLPPGALVIARLKPAHLPEHRSEWTDFDRLSRPAPSRDPIPVMVRRRLDEPRVLARRPSGRMLGPFLVNGGWWTGKTLRRKYYYVEQKDGRILWISYDMDADRFLLWGDVE